MSFAFLLLDLTIAKSGIVDIGVGNSLRILVFVKQNATSEKVLK